MHLLACPCERGSHRRSKKALPGSTGTMLFNPTLQILCGQVGWVAGWARRWPPESECVLHPCEPESQCVLHSCKRSQTRRMRGGVVLRSSLRFGCNDDLLRASVCYTQASECECGTCTSEGLCARAGGCVVWGLDAEKLLIENALACLVGGGALRGMVHKPKAKQAPTQTAGH